jgi:FlaA1/EpsC-like NDP-sugar epimerase
MPFNRFAKPLLSMPRIGKRLFALTVDAFLCVLTVWAALGLRLDQWGMLSGVYWRPVVASLLIALPLFVVFGFYRAIFRYAGWAALVNIGKAMAIYGLLFALIFTLIGVSGVPRTIGIIQPLLLLIAVGSSRIMARYWLGGMYRSHLVRAGMAKVLIYGAGSAGRQLAEVLANSSEMLPVGFLDDDRTLQGNTINGLPVYRPASLESVVSRLNVTDVLLAIPSASRTRRNEILSTLQSFSLRVRTLPGLMDLAHGKVHLSDLRELEIEDLLGRDAVAPNSILLNKNIRNKVVLVTGAGGSIGSELCRQIAKSGPSVLLMVEVSEFALYMIHQELEATLSSNEPLGIRLVPLLASVRDAERMEEIMATWRPHTVYHAAAYKHVPLVEHNPAEGVKNNVFGTLITARAAREHGVANFVLISTDKAVRPTNVMGASKRLAEMVLQAMASNKEVGESETRFSMVRFGNVLGSSGSVVPKFRQQIKNGGPITLTHADITRYFMTIPEAAQLVIQAGAMASGGDVFVLDMGQPIRIFDLALRMVELSGLRIKDEAHPDGDIEIVITGLRPGEKLYEELLIGDNPELTQHTRIMKAHEDCLPWKELENKLDALKIALDLNDVGVVRRILESLVSGYQPSSEVVDWVHLELEAEVQADSSNGGSREFSF